MAAAEASREMGHQRCHRSSWIAAAFLFAGSAAQHPPDEVAYREIATLSERGEWPAVEAKLEAAKHLANAQSQWSWGLRIERAVRLIATGGAREALDILSVAPPIAYAHSEPAVKRLAYEALALQLLGSPREALETIKAAATLAETKPTRVRLEVEHIRANIDWLGHRTDDAELHARALIRLARRNSQRDFEVKGEAVLALVLAQRERFDEAITHNEKALPIARQLGLSSLVQKIEVNLAWQYSALGQYDRAEDVVVAGYNDAVRLNARLDIYPRLLERGNIRYYRQDYEGASQFYRQAYELGKTMAEVNAGQAVANMAVVALATNDYTSARRYNAEALELKRKSHDAEAELHSLLIDARIDLGLGKAVDAESLLNRVIDETTSKSLRWQAQTRLAEVYAETKRPAEADAEFQRALDAADDARSEVGNEELRMTFASTVRDFYDAYINFLINAGRDIDALRVTEQSRARTLAEGLGFDIDQSASLDPSRIARERGAVILVYWLAPPRSFLWAISGSGVKLFKLPSSRTLDSQIDEYSRELVGPHPSLARGERLYQTLVAPASGSIVSGARLVIIPDGHLGAFNMETLAVHGRYWIEDAIIETAPSLQLAARTHSAQAGAGRLLLVGDPRVPDAAFPPLPHAAGEMKRVRGHFAKMTERAGSAATPGAYERDVPNGYSFIHFVAHGIANLKRPLDSAVVLSGEGDRYKLYGRDIVRHPLTARLVTISSCHGAGTRTYAGEGLVGLAWAFLRAGAHQVIAALWEVNDSATPGLMDTMYAGIQAGHDPATALRDAKLALIHSNGIHRHPLYWAPFVLYSGS
jgi:CHAT domain-containing protein